MPRTASRSTWVRSGRPSTTCARVTLFVLSGFLLYRVFVSAALRDRPMPSVPNYLRNRALRIVPAYVAVLLAVALVFEHELLTRPLQLGANLLFLQNYIPAYIGTSPDAAGIAPAWSIVIEVSFYLVLPVLGYIAIRLARRHGIVAALVPVALMVAAGLAARGLARLLDDRSDALWIFQHSLPTHADWFAAGMAVAVAQVLYEDGRLRLPSWWRPAAVAAAVALALGGMKLFYEGILNGLTFQTPIAFGCALLLAVIVLAEPGSAPVRVLGSRAFVFAGLVSYSVFLIHDPLVRGFRDWGLTMDGRAGFVVNLLVIGGLTFALATVTYRYVEQPALARKRRWQASDSAGLGSAAPPGGDGSATAGARPATRGDSRSNRQCGRRGRGTGRRCRRRRRTSRRPRPGGCGVHAAPGECLPLRRRTDRGRGRAGLRRRAHRGGRRRPRHRRLVPVPAVRAERTQPGIGPGRPGERAWSQSGPRQRARRWR